MSTAIPREPAAAARYADRRLAAAPGSRLEPDFGEATVETRDGTHLFNRQIHLGGIDPDSVQVEMYADALPSGDPISQAMIRLRPLAGEQRGYTYSATLSTTRPSSDFTARIVAHGDGVAVPLENARILWER